MLQLTVSGTWARLFIPSDSQFPLPCNDNIKTPYVIGYYAIDG